MLNLINFCFKLLHLSILLRAIFDKKKSTYKPLFEFERPCLVILPDYCVLKDGLKSENPCLVILPDYCGLKSENVIVCVPTARAFL